MPCLQFKWLKSVIRRFHLRVFDLQLSCNGFTRVTWPNWSLTWINVFWKRRLFPILYAILSQLWSSSSVKTCGEIWNWNAWLCTSFNWRWMSADDILECVYGSNSERHWLFVISYYDGSHNYLLFCVYSWSITCSVENTTVKDRMAAYFSWKLVLLNAPAAFYVSFLLWGAELYQYVFKTPCRVLYLFNATMLSPFWFMYILYL